MPVYTIQGPDGRTYTIEGPEGATPEQLGNYVTSQKAADVPKATSALVESMSGPERFAAGAGKAVADTGLGLRQVGAGVMDLVTPRGNGKTSRVDDMRAEVQGVRDQDQPLVDSRGGFWGNVAGNAAMALIPGGAVMLGGKALAKLPAAANIAKSMMTGGRAMMAPTSIPTAIGVGAAQGAVQPSTSTEETIRSAGLGAGASALVPTAIRGGQLVKAAIDPFREGGQKAIVGRALNNAAGGEAATMQQNVREATAPFVGPTPEGQIARTMMGEVVPGSVPTMGQVAGVPSIAALERTAVASDPTATNLLTQRLGQQNAARVNAIEDVAGTHGKREFFENNRKATADALYDRARQNGVDPATFTPEAQANIAAFQQRVPDDILQRAQELAKINGVQLDNASSVQGMHWVKKAIDSKINTAKSSGDKEMAAAYTGLQKSLLEGMDAISPAYGEARRTFSAMSKPINEMQVAQALADRSINPLTGNVAPQAFAKALNDKTAASVTGMKNATLENTMSPQGLNTLERVKEDLARATLAQNAGRGPGSDTVQKLAYSNLLQQSGLPSWSTAVPRAVGMGGAAQRVGDLAYKGANEEMRAKLAQALLNPQDAAALMEAGIVSPALQQTLQNARRTGGALGAAAPYLLNPSKE